MAASCTPSLFLLLSRLKDLQLKPTFRTSHAGGRIKRFWLISQILAWVSCEASEHNACGGSCFRIQALFQRTFSTQSTLTM